MTLRNSSRWTCILYYYCAKVNNIVHKIAVNTILLWVRNSVLSPLVFFRGLLGRLEGTPNEPSPRLCRRYQLAMDGDRLTERHSATRRWYGQMLQCAIKECTCSPQKSELLVVQPNRRRYHPWRTATVVVDSLLGNTVGRQEWPNDAAAHKNNRRVTNQRLIQDFVLSRITYSVRKKPRNSTSSSENQRSKRWDFPL